MVAIWQWPSIGLDNGFAQNRQQAIIWTYDRLVYRRIYASLCLNELTHRQLEMHGCVISVVATDALALKRQVISNHTANSTFYFTGPVSYKTGTLISNKIRFWNHILKKMTQLF